MIGIAYILYLSYVLEGRWTYIALQLQTILVLWEKMPESWRFVAQHIAFWVLSALLMSVNWVDQTVYFMGLVFLEAEPHRVILNGLVWHFWLISLTGWRAVVLERGKIENMNGGSKMKLELLDKSFNKSILNKHIALMRFDLRKYFLLHFKLFLHKILPIALAILWKQVVKLWNNLIDYFFLLDSTKSTFENYVWTRRAS